jgi:outer membrane protein assembly factor BamA
LKINLFANISLILILLASLSSCISTKRVEDGDYLLEKNIVYVNDSRTFDNENQKYIKQHPNQKFFGFYPFYLHLFNLADLDPKEQVKRYKFENPRTISIMEKMFSRKAVSGLENDYIGIQNWLKETGEAPVILNDKKTTKSTGQLAQLYKNRGYFRAISTDSIDYEFKKSKVKYYVNTGPAYFIEDIKYEINSDIIQELFDSEKDKTLLIKGNQYNQTDFYKEQNRLTSLFRNNGIYNFRNQFISFEVDSNLVGHKVNVKMMISDFPIETEEGVSYTPHKQYFINKVNVYPDYLFEYNDLPVADSISKDGYYFLAKKKNRFKPKALTNAIYFEPGRLYSDEDRKRTIKLLGGLGMFRMTDVKVVIDSTDDSGVGLTSNIYLTPLKRNTTKVEVEGTNSNTLGFGFAVNTSVTNRNTFGGAEILSISLNMMVGNQVEAEESDVGNPIFNAYQYGIQTSLRFPRFLLPFSTDSLVTKDMRPRTTIKGSLNNQLNIGLSKNSNNISIDYAWNSSDTKEHIFELYNFQYIKYLNSEKDYFRANPTEAKNVYEAQEVYLQQHPELEPIKGTEELFRIMINDPSFQDDPTYDDFANSIQRYERLTQDYLISSFSYSYIYNSQRYSKEKSFLYFKGKVELAGSMFSLIDKVSPLPVITDAQGFESKTIFGLPYAQFVKFDFDFRKYWRLNSNDKIAFRALAGLTLPFGNSNSIPFERSYFSGGVSDVRAWKPYELGPGGVKDYAFDYSYDKVKLTFSLEYRKKVFNKLHGALFVDAGNIWGINNEDDLSNFNIGSFYKQFGVGTGYGIRYDFGFFVFRFDFAYKLWDPGKPDGQNWVLKEQKFWGSQVNFAIGYPF